MIYAKLRGYGIYLAKNLFRTEISHQCINIRVCLSPGTKSVWISPAPISRCADHRKRGEGFVARLGKNCMGFTLIEIMIVISLISILVAIAIPQFAAYRERSMDVAAKSALRNLAVAQENYYYFNNTYTANRGLLNVQNGWTIEPNVNLNIVAANRISWSATAQHISSSSLIIYSSSEGGLR